MRKLLVSLFTILALLSHGPQVLFLHTHAQQKPIPPYAKWGKIAMEKTHEKYPQAQIIDYLHVGRTTGPNTTTEKFKLWLKGKDREFGVFVDIEFDTKTEKVLKVTFKETSR